MRYLNKIIFINNNWVKYAEVKLDGNVHLQGTQGVGKSTLLRAILFFYNADKLKLGISKSKSNFDSYYLPNPTSSIIFEVVKDELTFCILVFRSTGGRAAYRFLDTPYQKEFFVHASGRVLDFPAIRNNLGKEVYFSTIIRSYKDYKNILYGNNKGLRSEFRKYALLETSEYQNIPNTIQNVFLNSKLEASFMKDTIIKSLHENEDSIDLTTYSKNHLRDFEMEYKDIKPWTLKHKKTGKTPIREEAEAVVEAQRHYRSIEKERIGFAKKLGYAFDIAQKKLPVLITDYQKASRDKQRLEERQAKLHQEHQKSSKELEKELILLANKFEEAEKKSAYYQEKDIQTILQKVAKEAQLEAQKQHLEEEKQLLTAQFQSIEAEYQLKQNKIRQELDAFKNQIEKKKNTLEGVFLNDEKKINEQFQADLRGLLASHEKQKTTIFKQLEAEKNERRDLDVQQIQVAQSNVKQTEIERQQEEKRKQQTEKQTAQSQLAILTTKVASLKKEQAYEHKQVADKASYEREKYEQEIVAQQKVATQLSQKLANNADTLYAWLNEYVPGWENHIGKVIDEEHVLFAKTSKLKPNYTKETQPSLYGVHLHLEGIPKEIKTLADYENELSHVQAQIEGLKAEKQNFERQTQEELARIKTDFTAQIQQKEQEIAAQKQKIVQSQNLIKFTESFLEELFRQAAKERKLALAAIAKQIQANKTAQKALNKELSDLQKAQQQQEQDLAAQKTSVLREKQAEKAKKLRVLDQQTSDKQEEIKKREKELQHQKQQKFGDKGLDTKRLQEIDDELLRLKNSLGFIAQHKRLVIEYEKDKKELFDKIHKYQIQHANFTEELRAENINYGHKKTALKEQLNELERQIETLRTQQKEITDELNYMEGFQKQEIFQIIAPFFTHFDKADQTTTSCIVLAGKIIELEMAIQKKYDALRTHIHTFVGHFDEKNLFQFPVHFEPNDTSAYFDFAQNLKEFITEDKIAEYQKRVNERFVHIIDLIGREITDIVAKEAEISKVVKKINEDFRAKNFVGAIKNIELKTIKSRHKIVQLLEDIRIFNQEQEPLIRKPNLFGADQKNEEAIKMLSRLLQEIKLSKQDKITLSDIFDLQFRIIENENDTGWVDKLSDVGSEGTDILAKAMINIMLLNVFKNKASKKFGDFRLHCIMDEIGRLHPKNVEGILRFANERNIILINGSPVNHNIMNYKYTFALAKDQKNVTQVALILHNTR